MAEEKKSRSLAKRETFSIGTPYKAAQMAVSLTNFIKDNKLSVNIQGHEYAMVEGWQFAGGLLGLFPMIKEVKEMAPMKWMAIAEIIDKKTGKVVSTGYAICSKEESKKRGFDEYAILSMAQTRAIGKAYRNYIGWVIKMAGYEATPAEEMTNEEKAKEATEKYEQALNLISHAKQKAPLLAALEKIKKDNGKNGYTKEQKLELEKAISLKLDEIDNPK